MICYADLHVHLGRAGAGRPVKISASRDLTLANILSECLVRKGIQMVGVVDAVTPSARSDLRNLLAEGDLAEMPGGGLRYRDGVTLIPGAESEIRVGERGRPAHFVAYLPGMGPLEEFGPWLESRVTNPELSTQRASATAAEFVQVAGALGGFAVAAHIFTPFKGVFGSTSKLGSEVPEILWEHLPAVELGLSADKDLASLLPELDSFAFLSNSDAHSAASIAREYNCLELKTPDLADLLLALAEREGRRIVGNYGLDPRLGKYHRTFCVKCDERLDGPAPVLACPRNSDHRVVPGVLDRITCLAGGDSGASGPGESGSLQSGPGRFEPGQSEPRRPRPPYVHQIPLKFVPGVGRKAYERLLEAFGTEMAVLHRATSEDLTNVVGAKTAHLIDLARTGHLAIEPGGGGHYGRAVEVDPAFP